VRAILITVAYRAHRIPVNHDTTAGIVTERTAVDHGIDASAVQAGTCVTAAGFWTIRIIAAVVALPIVALHPHAALANAAVQERVADFALVAMAGIEALDTGPVTPNMRSGRAAAAFIGVVGQADIDPCGVHTACETLGTGGLAPAPGNAHAHGRSAFLQTAVAFPAVEIVGACLALLAAILAFTSDEVAAHPGFARGIMDARNAVVRNWQAGMAGSTAEVANEPRRTIVGGFTFHEAGRGTADCKAQVAIPAVGVILAGPACQWGSFIHLTNVGVPGKVFGVESSFMKIPVTRRVAGDPVVRWIAGVRNIPGTCAKTSQGQDNSKDHACAQESADHPTPPRFQ
jgi:hypothetical protein